MLKFISKTLLSMVMEPNARAKLEKISQARKPPRIEPGKKIDVNSEPPRKETPERRELIRKALEVQRSKSIILDGLSLEDRMKLRILASEIFKNTSSLKKR